MAIRAAVSKTEVLQHIPKIVFTSAFVLLTAATGINLVSPLTSFDVLIGGIVGIINFYCLASTVKRSIAFDLHRIKRFVAFRYWLRFSATAVVVYYLVSKQVVHPAAFIAGFSIVIFTLFL